MKAEIENCEGFEWDAGNANKNWHLHAVTNGECEDVFFNLPLIIAADQAHSENEARFFALGRTDANRRLFMAFKLRNDLIRVISARDVTKSETRKYVEKIKRDSEI